MQTRASRLDGVVAPVADGSEAIALRFAEQVDSVSTQSYFAHLSNHIGNALQVLETAHILRDKDRLRVYHLRDIVAAKKRLHSALELIARQIAAGTP